MTPRKKIAPPLSLTRRNHSESLFSFITLLSQLLRRDKVILYQGSSNYKVTVYFYRHDPRHVFVSDGNGSVRISEAEMPAVDAAIDKFVQDTA
jgi:hypothetical protein